MLLVIIHIYFRFMGLQMKKILLTGGAGYIGSHTNALLNALGFETIVIDNLSLGHKESLDFSVVVGGGGQNLSLKAESKLEQFFKDSTSALNSHSKQLISAIQNPPASPSSLNTFIQADLSDKMALAKVFAEHKIDSVLHFVAFAYVGESVVDPAKYYRNNVANTLNLLEVMREFEVQNIIFSSTCATYGNPLHSPITESHPQNPINPYGQSKLMVEKILCDFALAYGLKYVILRYFNAAGASTFFDLGESHNPETHLIPLVIQTALGQREFVSVFGADYLTKDGSCVRDFIHIDDLAMAHILALLYLRDNGKSNVFNLGNGSGFSVFEVLSCMQEIIGEDIPKVVESRRAGDPAILVGDSTKARNILGWNPQFCDLRAILQSALMWHKNARY